jgi:hypothetical protein
VFFSGSLRDGYVGERALDRICVTNGKGAFVTDLSQKPGWQVLAGAKGCNAAFHAEASSRV